MTRKVNGRYLVDELRDQLRRALHAYTHPLPQEDLIKAAERAGMKLSWMQAILTDTVIPTMDELVAICHALDVRPEIEVRIGGGRQ